jgi:antitoxin HigA-1
LNPVHPGDVLREDFMKPMKLTAYAVAEAMGTTPIAISQICRGKRSESAEMALKLGRLFNASPELSLSFTSSHGWGLD